MRAWRVCREVGWGGDTVRAKQIAQQAAPEARARRRGKEAKANNNTYVCRMYTLTQMHTACHHDGRRTYLAGHGVPLVELRLPPAEEGEAGLNVQLHAVGAVAHLRVGDVADLVPVVDVVRPVREEGHQALCVFCVLCV